MRKDSLQDPLKVLGFLLHDLCVDLGFCNRLTPAELLPPGAVVNAHDFACAVLRAEGMNPDYELHWVRQIKRLIRNPA